MAHKHLYNIPWVPFNHPRLENVATSWQMTASQFIWLSLMLMWARARSILYSRYIYLTVVILMRIFSLLTKYAKLFGSYGNALIAYFYNGIRKKKIKLYLRTFVSVFVHKMNECIADLKRFDKSENELDISTICGYNKPSLERLKNVTLGLHKILSKQSHIKYSLLLPVWQPNLLFLKKTLQSLLDQSAPHKEILIGIMPTVSLEVLEVVTQFIHENSSIAKEILITPETQSIYSAYNILAQEAFGDYLFFMKENDWIRPDLLFRCEQMLQLKETPQVLYCNEFEIDAKDQLIQEIDKPLQPYFPYFFENNIGNGYLISRNAWNTVFGFNSSLNGAEEYDLMLRLDLAGALFQNVLCPLYARRQLPATTEAVQNENIIKALENYTQSKNLNWEWIAGYSPGTFRAIPKHDNPTNVHVIILFKDKKDLVLAAVKSMHSQIGVKIKVTAVASHGSDEEIVKILTSIGVEVLKVDEPFNYSRLNNYGVKNSRISSEYDTLLLLNDDVELEPDAVLEMIRWLNQPNIGVVGCRLHYPEGSLQHGGVDLCRESAAKYHMWYHPECNMNLEQMKKSKVIRICPAVTAAAIVMKRKTFLEIGGFDEIFYPITYSDTNLAIRLKAHGLLSLYTPFAVGKHHESISRGRHYNIEDFEKSSWLHHMVLEKYLTEYKLPSDKFGYLDH